LPVRKPVRDVEEVPGGLQHPSTMRLADNASDLDATRLKRDYEQEVEARQAGPGKNLDREEVTGRDGIPMRAQESLPGDPLGALGGWFDSVARPAGATRNHE